VDGENAIQPAAGMRDWGAPGTQSHDLRPQANRGIEIWVCSAGRRRSAKR